VATGSLLLLQGYLAGASFAAVGGGGQHIEVHRDDRPKRRRQLVGAAYDRVMPLTSLEPDRDEIESTEIE
jgi:hypothetical protein